MSYQQENKRFYIYMYIIFYYFSNSNQYFLNELLIKNMPANAGDAGNAGNAGLWVGKIPWNRNGNPLQYSCLRNPTGRGASWATVHGVTNSQT